MKKFLSFISLFFLSISINCYALELSDWKEFQDENIIPHLSHYFDKLRCTEMLNLKKEEYNIWQQYNTSVISNYNRLLNNDKIDENVLQGWWQYNEKIYNAIKDEKWPGISKKNAKDWYEKCKSFKKAYEGLNSRNKRNDKSKNNQTQSNQGNNTGNNNNSYRRAPQASEEEYRNHISRENNELSTENSEILNASAKAFEVCLFYPLAVKYNKTYCRLAYEAAKALIDLNIASIDSRMQSDWDKISPLLQKYGEYNEDVINYLNYCKSEIMSNRGKVTYSDIDHYKKMMRSKMNKYYYIYIDDETIPYLNNVLDDFFEILQEFANNDDAIKENFFNNFINVNLEPEE